MLIGTSRHLQALRQEIIIAARTPASVLILGETGTGKEVVAHAIHEDSQRYGRFVPVDCGALPEHLIEAELFGYARGAFTGATTDKQGLFEYAHQGTLFLDEIGNSTPYLQSKLLRALQDGRIRRIGEVRERPIDVRVLSATNAHLPILMDRREFRHDLYYRLSVFTISVPPLRERPEDIPILAASFLERLNRQHQTSKRFTTSAIRSLQDYAYPGNVRELEHLVARAYYAADGLIATVSMPLPQAVPDSLSRLPANFWREIATPYQERHLTKAQVRAVIEEGLKTTKGHYRQLLPLIGVPNEDYKRFMDFLRRHHLLVDYRQYRNGDQHA